MDEAAADLAFAFLTSVIFCEDYDDMTSNQRLLMQEGMTAFVASRPSAVFRSPQCKNKHNVYKSRARKSNIDGKEQGND